MAHRTKDADAALKAVVEDAHRKINENMGEHLDLMKKSINDFIDTMQDIRTEVYNKLVL